MEHKYTLGKVDYNNSGRRNCKAELTWRFDGVRFSMCANIWNPCETDIYCGGQCVEEVAAYFPHDAKAQRMLAIWRDYHLNDMHSGSPRQSAFVARLPECDRSYEEVCLALAEAGLNPDTEYMHDGKPYSYGTARLTVEIPQEVRDEIDSWSI